MGSVIRISPIERTDLLVFRSANCGVFFIRIMLTKDQKKKIIAELEDILKNNENIIFTDFTGLTMAELSELKRDLKKDKFGYKVFKKSLLEKALAKSDKRPDLSAHKGSIALAYGGGEPAGLAKKIHGFAVKSKKLSILAGYLINEMRTTFDVVQMAKLPSREVLLSQVLQLMMSPISGLARVLDGISKKEKVVKSNNTNTRMETNDTNEERLLASFAID